MSKLELKFGNHKLGDDTAILNMGTAVECPSRKLGLCKVVDDGIKCYAEKAEVQYPNTVPAARKRQEKYWKTTEASKIATDIIAKIKRRRKTTKYLRFNESGDFWSQDDIAKLSVIAEYLALYDVTVYGNSARADLDFKNAAFLVKGSGHDKGNNGKSIVIGKTEVAPKGFKVCTGDCRKCNMCKKEDSINIAFRRH